MGALDTIIVPEKTILFQNFPNPFTQATKIRFQLTGKQHVQIAVFNDFGKRVKTLIEAELPAGSYHIIWDGTDDYGERIPPGEYNFRLRIKGYISI